MLLKQSAAYCFKCCGKFSFGSEVSFREDASRRVLPRYWKARSVVDRRTEYETHQTASFMYTRGRALLHAYSEDDDIEIFPESGWQRLFVANGAYCSSHVGGGGTSWSAACPCQSALSDCQVMFLFLSAFVSVSVSWSLAASQPYQAASLTTTKRTKLLSLLRQRGHSKSPSWIRSPIDADSNFDPQAQVWDKLKCNSRWSILKHVQFWFVLLLREIGT